MIAGAPYARRNPRVVRALIGLLDYENVRIASVRPGQGLGEGYGDYYGDPIGWLQLWVIKRPRTRCWAQ